MEYLPHWFDMQDLSAYLLLGAVAGLAAGLLGVGGGLIIVPALILVFSARGFDATIVAHLAIGTSLTTIVATSISSVAVHHQKGAVQWSLVGQLSAGIVLGACLGVAVADRLPTALLIRAFGVFAILAGAQMLLDLQPNKYRNLPGKFGLWLAGGMIGCLSTIVGIGGGTMTVPFLNWCRVSMRQAVATSSACGLPIAIAGGLGFAVAGWDGHLLPSGSSGFVYWPAVVGIIISSILCAPLGAHIAHKTSTITLKRVFALLLFLVGGRMIV